MIWRAVTRVPLIPSVGEDGKELPVKPDETPVCPRRELIDKRELAVGDDLDAGLEGRGVAIVWTELVVASSRDEVVGK